MKQSKRNKYREDRDTKERKTNNQRQKEEDEIQINKLRGEETEAGKRSMKINRKRR